MFVNYYDWRHLFCCTDYLLPISYFILVITTVGCGRPDCHTDWGNIKKIFYCIWLKISIETKTLRYLHSWFTTVINIQIRRPSRKCLSDVIWEQSNGLPPRKAAAADVRKRTNNEHSLNYGERCDKAPCWLVRRLKMQDRVSDSKKLINCDEDILERR